MPPSLYCGNTKRRMLSSMQVIRCKAAGSKAGSLTYNQITGCICTVFVHNLDKSIIELKAGVKRNWNNCDTSAFILE